jgi:isoleucyl-tRNA synthetase
LYDFDPAAGEKVTLKIDRWAMGETLRLQAYACERLDVFDFSAALTAIHNFCAKELSGFYLDVIKDRLYCDAKESQERRSAQAACHQILLVLTKLVAAILPHTAEEVYAKTPLLDRKPSVMIEKIDVGEAPPPDSDVATLLAFRDRLNASLEAWKADSGVKDTQDVLAKAVVPGDIASTLEAFGSDLPTFLKLSWIEISNGEDEHFEFGLSPYEKCERCRLRRPDVREINGIMLSERDAKVLGW